MANENWQNEAIDAGLSGKALKRRKGKMSSKAAHKSRANTPAERRAPKTEAPVAEPVMVAAE